MVMPRFWTLLLVGLMLLPLGCQRNERSLLHRNESTITKELRTLQVITSADVLVDAQPFLRQDSVTMLYWDVLDDLQNRLAYTDDKAIRDSLTQRIEEYKALIIAYQKQDNWTIVSYRDSLTQDVRRIIIDSAYHYVKPYTPPLARM
jgi:hypothetical protein